MGGLVVVEHQVDGVRGSTDEDDLENGVVERLGLVEGPEKIDVARNVYDEVEELRLERDTGCALLQLDGAVCGRQGFMGVRLTTSSSEAESKWTADGKDPLGVHGQHALAIN